MVKSSAKTIMTFFKESQQRIASFFMVKNLDQETSMPKAQWKVFWRCKRGRPMEGRPRTSTLSLSLLLVCSPILNGIVIFMYFKLKSLVKGLQIELKYLPSILVSHIKILVCDVKILYYNILIFLL